MASQHAPAFGDETKDLDQVLELHRQLLEIPRWDLAPPATSEADTRSMEQLKSQSLELQRQGSEKLNKLLRMWLVGKQIRDEQQQNKEQLIKMIAEFEKEWKERLAHLGEGTQNILAAKKYVREAEVKFDRVLLTSLLKQKELAQTLRAIGNPEFVKEGDEFVRALDEQIEKVTKELRLREAENDQGLRTADSPDTSPAD
jgi:hypothetical protein